MQHLLALFDIDGTLLVDDASTHGEAMTDAMRRVYSIDLPDDAVQRVAPWGKTDLRIAREVLHAAGLRDRAIDAGLARWVTVAGALFASLAPQAHAAWRQRDGLRTALDTLDGAGVRLALLTGNLRAVAEVKLACMGLADRFEIAISAFGNDAEDRRELGAIARTRAAAPAAAWRRERTVVIGDTPSDIATARADGLRSIVFASGRYPGLALDGATVIASDMTKLVEVLLAWQRDVVAS